MPKGDSTNEELDREDTTLPDANPKACTATLILIAVGALTRNVHADVSCMPVHGTITSVRTTQNCTSPIGICTVGTIAGAGLLEGTTTFVALDAAPSAGMSTLEPSTNLSYSGQLTIVTRNGTLVTRDLGVLEQCMRHLPKWNAPSQGPGCSRIPGVTTFSYLDQLLITDKDSRESCRVSFASATGRKVCAFRRANPKGDNYDLSLYEDIIGVVNAGGRLQSDWSSYTDDR